MVAEKVRNERMYNVLAERVMNKNSQQTHESKSYTEL